MINNNAYSKMLKIQSDLCFPFEALFYLDIGIENMKQITEIGCGNGCYLNMLAKQYPNAVYTGLDINEQLLNKAFPKDNVVFSVGSSDKLASDNDLVILRLILHQIENKDDLLAEISEKVKSGSYIVVIDPYDQDFKIMPEMKAFNNHLSEHRKLLSPNNATRNTSETIVDELESLGFDLIKMKNYSVSSMIDGYKEKFYDYMKHTIEMTGSDEKVSQELKLWKDDMDSYIQIGLYISAFKKK
jgi:trans-aconitate methyltransferase